MTKKLSSEQSGEATVVAVRLPPDLLAGLDRAVVQASAPPCSHPSRSVVARGLIASALQTPLFTTEAPSQPTFQKKEATMKKTVSTPESTWETITPEVATRWLEKNVGNRSINATHVKKLASEITRGAFKLTHQGIAFDINGMLIDGQHRLSAIVLANTPVFTQVTRGLPVNAREAIDIGTPRNVAHWLAMKYGWGYEDARYGSALIHCLFGLAGHDRSSVSKSQLESAFTKHYDGLSWAIKQLSDRKTSPVPTPVLASLAWAYPHAPKACDYIADKYKKPTNLPEGSPVLALQNAARKTNKSHSPADRRDISLKALRVLEAVLDKQPLYRVEANSNSIDRLCERFGIKS